MTESTQITQFNPAEIDNSFEDIDKAISLLEKKYLQLKIMGIDDKEGYEKVDAARKDVKRRRIAVEKRRKALVKPALDWQRKTNTAAKMLTGKLDPIYDHLEGEQKRIDDEKARIKAEEERRIRERTQQRTNKLIGCGCLFDGVEYRIEHGNQAAAITLKQLQTVPDELFDDIYSDIRALHDEKVEARRKEQEEQERLRKENEEKDAEITRLRRQLQEPPQPPPVPDINIHRTSDTKEHLCDTCQNVYPMCDAEKIEFGDGKGNDNVIGCDKYSEKPTSPVEEAVPEKETTVNPETVTADQPGKDNAKTEIPPTPPEDIWISKDGTVHEYKTSPAAGYLHYRLVKN